MIYLNLTEDNYLRGITFGPEPKPDEEESLPPHIKDLAGVDLGGIRMGAYRWDGEKLTLDEDRLAALEKEEAAAKKEAAARTARQTAVQEVQAALITEQINTLAVDDSTALRWRVLYPAWTPKVAYKQNEKVQYANKLYRCQQAHTSQTGWEPDRAASLWTEVCETHAGTVDDPIPYSGNMVLEAGKYYAQDGVTYRCTRDTGIPVYNPLAELVGLYVEVSA